MASLLLLNKPFQVLCQFTDSSERKTLAEYINTEQYPGYYPAGRLDYDSEGLVALTNDGQLQHQLANPQFKLPKTYWVQVEGQVNQAAIKQLSQGLELKDGPTSPCKAQHIKPPAVWERHPPIRERKHIPTHWLEVVLTEGRNRQVRRMTAAVGLPTLRLIRYAIGQWTLDNLSPGDTQEVKAHLPRMRAKKPLAKTKKKVQPRQHKNSNKKPINRTSRRTP